MIVVVGEYYLNRKNKMSMLTAQTKEGDMGKLDKKKESMVRFGWRALNCV